MKLPPLRLAGANFWPKKIHPSCQILTNLALCAVPGVVSGVVPGAVTGAGEDEGATDAHGVDVVGRDAGRLDRRVRGDHLAR